ncbi:MAG TPA: 1-(5-phosphoribosyl)-5-[(5-phosphoribosylamino)methylideneamino]imidazole-4-carboxamide isomerase [Puia sp.]
MEIIPAIDIIDGKCVRLTQGDYEQKKIYNEHPLEVAWQFEDAGLRRLHLVDLDGAKAGAVKNWKVLETIAGKTSLVIDFGGGIKKEEDVQIVLNSGAALATIGSLAVKDPELFHSWLQQYGADRFLLGADVKNEKIAVGGWLETTDRWIYDFIREYIDRGIKQVFCTDVSKDGLLQGPALDLYRTIKSEFPKLHFIASGGVSTIADVYDLAEIGCKGVIIGKAIYEGRITLKELIKINQEPPAVRAKDSGGNK